MRQVPSPVLLTAAAVLAIAGAALAAPLRYQAPPESRTLAPGAGVELAQAQCSVCHSVDYITTQPRKLANPKAFWTGEVTKMRKVYGASIRDEDVAKIADYLAAAYGG